MGAGPRSVPSGPPPNFRPQKPPSEVIFQPKTPETQTPASFPAGAIIIVSQPLSARRSAHISSPPQPHQSHSAA